MRRLPTIFVLAASLLGLAAINSSPAGGQAAEGGFCPNDIVVRGVVRDAATGLRLNEVTSVEHEPWPPFPGGTAPDGEGTDANSVYRLCLEEGTYRITFRADNYRVARIGVAAQEPAPVVRNIALTPKGRVIAGRVTNMNGVPKFASVGIWRQRPNGTWRSIDGEGNSLGNGWYAYRVPGYGRYRVSACVDNHWCQWSLSADRLRHARVVNVVPSGPNFINDVHVRVPFCRPRPATFCVTLNFLT